MGVRTLVHVNNFFNLPQQVSTPATWYQLQQRGHGINKNFTKYFSYVGFGDLKGEGYNKSKATYKEQLRLAACSTRNIEFIGKVR